MTEIKQAIKSKMEQAGIPHESIAVFGAIRLNVHVKCVGFDSANKWAQIISSALKGADVKVVKTTFEAKENKGTNLRPTMKSGYLIAATY